MNATGLTWNICWKGLKQRMVEISTPSTVRSANAIEEENTRTRKEECFMWTTTKAGGLTARELDV